LGLLAEGAVPDAEEMLVVLDYVRGVKEKVLGREDFQRPADVELHVHFAFGAKNNSFNNNCVARIASIL
jgi:hypothetical protein